ncbi:MAG: hypothetical protein ACP59X_21510 [Solidesulfovibrio sp. DCME]|uniref:hypothetical protein n=1 Tax=Solidesulfovibrio sp. DCME TaxID=3447380 RepID=UPI003D0A6A6C
MDHDSLEKKFENAFSVASATSPVFSHEAKQQMGKMVETILRGNKNMQTHPGLAAANRGGFIAEEFHVESFNLDTILKNKDIRAYTDKYHPEWLNLSRRGNDGATDIVVVQDGKEVLTAQSKYCASAEDTSRALSEVKDSVPKYGDNDVYLAPSDQVKAKDGCTGISEHAEAASYAQEQAGKTIESKASAQTARKVRDVIEQDGVSSSPLTKEEATKLGEGDLSKIKKIESQYQTQSTIQQVTNAASGAAALSAIVCGTVNVVKYIQMVRNGEIAEEEAILKIICETASSAADSAVKAGSVVCAQSLLVRYGAESVVIDSLARQSVSSLLKTNAATVGVVCMIDAIKDLVLLGTDKITSDQFFERQGKGILNTSSGIFGGSLGAVSAQTLASSFGLNIAMVTPLVGGLAGGLIAGLAMNLAIENHVEKPYKELVYNTENLRGAVCELQRLSQFVFKSQVLFVQVFERDHQLDQLFASKLDKIDETGLYARSVIAKI